MIARVITGDCLDELARLDAGSAQTCVTSPPYFGLRDYGVAGQLGLERTPAEYVAQLVTVFRGVRRALADDGTLWLNLGDSYATAGTRQGNQGNSFGESERRDEHRSGYRGRPAGLKQKDLIGIPWRAAFALQEDGWYLRSDIIWAKPNPMPESVTDRPTKSHEYLFLLAKSERYYYDAAAIAEPVTQSTIDRVSQPTLDEQEGSRRVPGKTNGTMKAIVKRSGNTERKYGEDRGRPGSHLGASIPWEGTTRNRRTVWTVTTQPFTGAHYATFPPKLIEPCILAGSRRGDTVLDPFGGAGTTGLVADRLGRDSVLIELNPAYAQMARDRIAADAPLFAGGSDG